MINTESKTLFRVKTFLVDSRYLSIMKPRLVFLLVLSAVAGYIAGEVVPGVNSIRWHNILLVIIAGSFSSGGASAFNSWYDRDIDFIMQRTKERPIPSGLIAPWKGFTFAVLSVLFGVFVAYIFLNPLTSLLMLIGAVWYSVVYTMIFKRRSRWNIIWGSPSGFFPVIAGWTAARGSLDAIFPFLIGFTVLAWIPVHFWSLAIRYNEEYSTVNLPMLPVVIGVNRAVKYIGISSLVLMLTVVGMILIPQTHVFFILGVIPLCFWLLKQIIVVFRDPTQANSWRLFVSSNIFLLLVEIAIIVDSGLQIYFGLA